MLFNNITVRTPINRKRLSYYCSKFFKLNFNSKYICVQAKVRDASGKTYNIGENYNINVSDVKNLPSYRIKIIDDYEKYLLLGNKSNCVLIFTSFTYVSFIALFNKEIFFF